MPPFESAVVEHILQRLSRTDEEIPWYPSLAQVLLSSPPAAHRTDCASAGRGAVRTAFSDPCCCRGLIRGLVSLKVGFVDFSGGGEPTLHPEFHELAQACIRGGLGLALTTNAAWSQAQSTDILLDGFSFLRIALDASNDQVHDRIHGRSGSRDFQKVLGNVERLMRERERRGSRLIAGGEALLTQANMNFVEEITGLARDLGLDYIRFRAETGPSDSLLPEQRETVGKLIEELKAAVHPFPVFEQVRIHGSGSGCRILPFHLVIDPCGDLYACSHFHQRPDLPCFGNLLSQPADKLWLGLAHSQTIKSLRAHQCNIHDCPWRFCPNLPQDAGR